MFRVFLLFCLGLGFANGENDYKINNDTYVDYIEGNHNYLNTNGNFSNSSVISDFDNLEHCKHNCAHNKQCIAILNYYNESCYLLSSVNVNIDSHNKSSVLYLKTTHRKIVRDEHTIIGYIFDSYFFKNLYHEYDINIDYEYSYDYDNGESVDSNENHTYIE